MNVLVEISKVNDGNMLVKKDSTNIEVKSNRASFLAKHGIEINQTTLVNIDYDGENYLRYYEVSDGHKGNGMLFDDIVAADALVTKSPNHALFLPIADCVGAAIYDPIKQILMLSHLGRHSLEQNGGYESIKYLVNFYGCEPNNLKVWLTPAPGPDVYPMYKFNDRSIKSVVFQQLQSAGIIEENITDNPSDTSKDYDYFSYSEFLKGNRQENGRYAIVTMMKE
ncbi:MAG: laccase domain-containing protein [Candidatus Saccharibacteria bacterium]